MSDHTITWTHTGDGPPDAKVECHAPAGSWCQVEGCPQGCEEIFIERGEPGRHVHTYWDSEKDEDIEHALTQGTARDCNIVAGITEDHPMYTHRPQDERTLGTYPINGHWDADHWEWDYATPALAVGQELASGDVEPPVGTVVVTDGWGVWSRFDDRRHGWQRLGDADATQSWAVVVATYGPVRVLTLTIPKEFS